MLMTNFLRSSLAPVVGLVGLLVWAYRPTLEFLYEKWSTDPQYSHGFLVPVFTGYLIYRRLTGSAVVYRPRPLMAAVVLVGVAVLRVLSGGLLFHQLDALSLMLAVAACVLAVGGWAAVRLTAAPILFLAFMIPLPYEIERNVGGPLKTAATIGSTYLLQTLGLPAVAEGNLILIDDVRLGVVDACSGIKMLTTFAAFSFAAVLLDRRTGFEKVMVLLGVVPIALMTNILRITATGVSYTLTTDKGTMNFLHDLYGWLMMPLGLACLGLELWVLGRLVLSTEGRS
jgi:exosortase